MSIVYVLIPLGLVLVGFAAWAFFWAVGSGQFDDLDTPGWSVLVDEKAPAADSDRASGDDADKQEPGT
jgi:cbb3-type cytochrome oxidase maturation protein